MKYANVTSTLALVAAVATGGAYAATELGRGSVGSRELRDRSVKPVDLSPSARPLAKATLRQVVEDVVSDPALGLTIKVQGEKGDKGEKGDTGAVGPAGAAGTPGVAGVTVRHAYGPDVAQGSTSSAVASCEANEKVLGGGARMEGSGDATGTVTASYPIADTDQGWFGTMLNVTTSSIHVHVYAVCAKVG